MITSQDHVLPGDTFTMNATNCVKIINPGAFPCHTEKKQGYFKITLHEGNLSITGVIGPKQNGDAYGGCGQIDMEMSHRDPKNDDTRTNNPIRPDEIDFNPGWDRERWLDFLDIWSEWHLNDMRAGCEHQRADGWDTKKLDDSKPLTQDNMAIWSYKKDHQNGLLCEPCPVCGYKYGSAWLSEPVPKRVIDFLQSLPETATTPAWV